MRLIDADALMEYCNNLKGKTIDANDIARFPTAVSWVSVKDRLPEESGDVLIYNGHCDVLGFSKRWQKFNTYDVLDDANNAIDVTHWQRLPEPPEEEN